MARLKNYCTSLIRTRGSSIKSLPLIVARPIYHQPEGLHDRLVVSFEGRPRALKKPGLVAQKEPAVAVDKTDAA